MSVPLACVAWVKDSSSTTPLIHPCAANPALLRMEEISIFMVHSDLGPSVESATSPPLEWFLRGCDKTHDLLVASWLRTMVTQRFVAIEQNRIQIFLL